MEARTIGQAYQSNRQTLAVTTDQHSNGGLSQSDTLCVTAHSALSTTTASAYHKQQQHGMRHNGIGILRITASAYSICRNCDMRHSGSVMSDMPRLAYAPSSIGAYYDSVIPPYAHIGIERYRHMRQEA
jgi:hypothetical protein